MPRWRFPILALLWAAGCGRTDVFDPPPRQIGPVPTTEVCDGLDNNIDGLIDEDFRDALGAYQHDEHCGQCNQPCGADAIRTGAACLSTPSGPLCGAVECAAGYIVTRGFTCVRWDALLCKPCLEDAECGDFEGVRCIELDGEKRCVVACVDGTCPEGHLCADDGLCRPASQSCNCTPRASFTAHCDFARGELTCHGTAQCVDGVLSECILPPEVCDGLDNNCDGIADEPYINEHGAYGVDIHHCGACGIDCTDNPLSEDELVCGGPRTDPRCVMRCSDALDGIDVGDALDADLQISTGCECVVQSVDDPPGPAGAAIEDLDANCDGADGVVDEGYYVAPDGADDAPGSPTSPMGTISSAIASAHASLSTATPRPHVFISAGSYPETITLREGVHLHGGYSPDFRAFDPTSYVAEVHAPSWQGAPGGAALVAIEIGSTAETLVEGIHFIGASAPSVHGAAIGAFIHNSGDGLRIENCVIQAGDGSDGTDGMDGEAGMSPPDAGAAGESQRLAIEDNFFECVDRDENRPAGGAGHAFSAHGAFELQELRP